MKVKIHNYKFLKKNPKITKIPSSISEAHNDYSKIICEVLNINLNIKNEMEKNTITNKKMKLNEIKNNININKVFLKRAKKKNLKIILNSNKGENLNSSYEHNNIRMQKIKKKPQIINPSSGNINNINIRKNQKYYQCNSDKNIKDTNSNNIISLNKNKKININLCNNKSPLLRKQKSFNSKITKKQNNSYESNNITKINHLENNKVKTIKTLNNINVILKNKNQQKKIKTINISGLNNNNNIFNNKVTHKKPHKIDNNNINHDKISNIKRLKKNKSISGLNMINMDLKNLKKYSYKIKKNDKLYNKTDISPNNKKIKLLKNNNNKSISYYYNPYNSKKNLSNINKNQHQHQLHNVSKGVKTESINLNLTNQKIITPYNSEKHIENSFILNDVNSFTLREESRKKTYYFKLKRKIINYNENNEYPSEIHHSYNTVFYLSKKSRSLSRKRDEKKKLNLLKSNNVVKNEENEIKKLNNILENLDMQINYSKLKNNKERFSEPKKLIDRIRKVIKIKKGIN